MEELNKGYKFTKAQIAELESLRAANDCLIREMEIVKTKAIEYSARLAELEKQEPVGYFYEDHTGSLRQAHDDQFFADHMPLFAAPVVSPDVEKLKAELREISEALNDPADNLTKTTAECIKSLKTELKAARKDADRYRWLRNDPPVWLAVRRFPGETPRGCYLDGRNLDDAIDEAIEQAKGGA